MNYLKQLEKFFFCKEKLLIDKLNFLKQQQLKQFQFEVQNVYNNLKQQEQKDLSQEEIKNIKIKFTDYYRNKMRKLQTILESDQDSIKLINDIIKINQKNIKKKNVLNLKKQFDEICKYENKTNLQMNYYQNPDFCSYLITKTFKKTFKELNEFLFYSFDLKHIKFQKQIKICGVGGGSGNDALAVYYSLKKKMNSNEFRDIQFNINVLDLNYKSWQQTTQDFYSKYFSNQNINFNWEKIDHSQSIQCKNYQANFITACWTLNESSEFQLQFWQSLINNNLEAIYIFIEGEQSRLDQIYDILKSKNKIIYYEKYSSPRKLIAI